MIKLPHIANFDDFDALASEPSVALRFVEAPDDLGRPDLIILPGTKATLADLAWLKKRGFDDGIRWLARTGTAVVGICGGFQILGETIDNPKGVEGAGGKVEGLGLLRASTVFEQNKNVSPRRGRTEASLGGRLESLAGIAIEGYEIHCGVTKIVGLPFASLDTEEGRVFDGAWSPDGLVWGTYLHDIFASDEFRKAWLKSLGASAAEGSRKQALDASLDALADAVEASLDMDALRAIIGLDGATPDNKGVHR